MTRINVVDPSELADPHLLAECRELPRVFGLALAGLTRTEVVHDDELGETFAYYAS